jgi:hypothetical protein
MNCRSSGPPRPAEEEEGSALAEGTPPVTARAVHSSAEDAAMGCSGASGGAGPAQKPTAPGGSVVGARPKAAPADAAAVDEEAAAALQLLEVVRQRKAALSGMGDARGHLLADETDPQFTALAAAHPGLVADAAPFTPEVFDAALAALVGGIARDEYIAFHFTDGASVGYILADNSVGLRASQVCFRMYPVSHQTLGQFKTQTFFAQVGQLGGGLSVCLETPTSLGWDKWGRGAFRPTVGLELWGSKATDVMLGVQREDGVDGKDCGKMDYVFVVKVKKTVLQRPDRRVVGRDCVSIIEKDDLTEQDDNHYLLKQHILCCYRLVSSQAICRCLRLCMSPCLTDCLCLQHNPNPVLQDQLNQRDKVLKVIDATAKLAARVAKEAAACLLGIGETAYIIEDNARVEVTVAQFDQGRVLAQHPAGRLICLGATVAAAKATNEDAFNRFPSWTRCGGTLRATPAGHVVEAAEDEREWIVGTTWWGVALAEGPGMSAGQHYCEFSVSRADGASGFSDDALGTKSHIFSHPFGVTFRACISD